MKNVIKGFIEGICRSDRLITVSPLLTFIFQSLKATVSKTIDDPIDDPSKEVPGLNQKPTIWSNQVDQNLSKMNVDQH